MSVTPYTETTNTYDRSQQIDKDEEPHRETAKPAQLGQDHQLQQVVHRRVDPPTSLRKQDPPRLGRHRVRHRIRNEFRLEGRKVLQEECGEETVFTEGEEVLLVERVDIAFGVFVDDPVGNDDRTTLVSRADTIERETPR